MGWSILGLVVLLVACGDSVVVEETTTTAVGTTAGQSAPAETSTSTTTSRPPRQTTTVPDSELSLTSGPLFNGQLAGLKPIPVVPGETVTVVVGDIAPGAVVEVGLDNINRNLLGEPVADRDGVIRFTFDLPEATPGVHSLEFRNTEGDVRSIGEVRLLYSGLPKVGDFYLAYVCCFEPPEEFELAKIEFGPNNDCELFTIGLGEGAIDWEGGMLVVAIGTPGSIGDATMTIRLTNVETGKIIEHDLEIRPDDYSLALTIRQVAVDVRQELQDGVAPGFEDDLFGYLEAAHLALNLPWVTPEMMEAVLSSGWFCWERPELEDLDPETQALLSRNEGDPGDAQNVFNLQRGSDRGQALENVLGAAELIDQGVDVGAWSSHVADSANKLLTAAARGLAILKILEAQDNGLDENRIASAQTALDEGEIHRSRGKYVQSIAAYSDVSDILR